MGSLRVLIADDHPLMRMALSATLTAADGIDVVAEASSGTEAVERAFATGPDVCVLDMRMPGKDGVETTREILHRRPGTAVLAVTTFSGPEYIVPVLRAGATGYLVKDAPPERIVDAVRAVGRGEAVVSPAMTRYLVDEVRQLAPEAGPPPADLSEREREVLARLATGESNQEIAAALFLAEATVKTHVSRLMAKLGAANRVQVVVSAAARGLVRLPRR